MKRRGFLGMLAASPLAAKQVAEEASMKLAGVEVGGLGKNEPLRQVGGIAGKAGDERVDKSVIAKLFHHSIPDFKLDELKYFSRNPTSINANTASLKSISLVSKVNMQARDDLEKSVHELKASFENGSFHDQRDAFYKKYGWWL